MAERRLITEHARGLKRTVPVTDTTTLERLVAEGHALLGVERDDVRGQCPFPLTVGEKWWLPA